MECVRHLIQVIRLSIYNKRMSINTYGIGRENKLEKGMNNRFLLRKSMRGSVQVMWSRIGLGRGFPDRMVGSLSFERV